MKITVSPDVLALNPDLAAELGPAADAGRSRRKFHNEPTTIDGIRFDSQAEGRRYGELRLLEREGAIAELQPSPERPGRRRFDLAGGATYTPDFAYLEGGREIVEDVKGGRATQTQIFRLKARLFREAYPDIELRIVH